MKINWYLINSGRLIEQKPLNNWPNVDNSKLGESWFDIEDATSEEIISFLAPLRLHPLMLKRCSDTASTPGVISFDKAILLEFPAPFNMGSLDPTYITIVLQNSLLVTIRSCPIPAIKELVSEMAAEKIPRVSHLVQLVYLILDELTDLSIQAETEARDKTLNIAKILVDNPSKVEASDLANLRWQVEKLISLIENQLYCVTGLDSSDNEALDDPHRKAYVKDLLSELEIAQMGIQRLETRVNGLYDSYQAMGNSRVEKRIRILTIISAITLPFSLIAGLLGMNVGGLPGTMNPQGFIIVIVLLAFIGAIELWFFKRKGWLD